VGDTDAGQQSGKTKYGRVPLWLYEAGVSLQAVATYGWLIGKYGHFDRISPSYATLAKELGVSRGSTIAYVKELQAVGAVRIVQSGAQGRQSNQFAIAFDAPFEVDSTGQHSDQSAGRPVSGLYSGGQPADPGGQRAVQEEDVLLQTKKTLSSLVPQQAQAPPARPENEREIDPSPVLAAYEDAIGRPLLGKVRQQMEADVRLRLEKDIPVAWLIDRARELAAKGWADLGLHCDRSTVPIHASRPDGLTKPCDAHDPFNRFVTNDDGDLIPCPTCHPAALAAARRQGAA
jgi:hypothetical protein